MTTMGTSMQHLSLRIIREEHSTLSAMMKAMRAMVERGPAGNPAQFFDVLRAMLFYFDEFPQRLHHTKETELLFPRVLKAVPELAEDIARLDRDHAAVEQAVRELQHLLLGWELLGESRMPAFIEKAHRYVDTYQEHMRLEETVILPQTIKALSDADWKELDAAFEENRNPYLGRFPPDPAYDRLFSRIMKECQRPE